jgi:hypothetical protein
MVFQTLPLKCNFNLPVDQVAMQCSTTARVASHPSLQAKGQQSAIASIQPQKLELK